MNRICAILVLVATSAVLATAQARLTPEQQARLDSLETQLVQRVESAQGDGAAVGMDGPWQQENERMERFVRCVGQVSSEDVVEMLVCLEPVRAYYEHERSYRKVRSMAHAFTQPIFLTKDNKLVDIPSFISRYVPTLTRNAQWITRLAGALHWNLQTRPQLPQQFVSNMLTWKNHLQQDASHK